MAYELNSTGENKAAEIQLVAQSKGRLTALMLSCIGFGLLILVRSAYIQILNNPRLERMAKRQYQSHSLIRPNRGFILDRQGESLAINVETQSLAANPSKIGQKKQLARLLSRSTDLSYSRLLQKFNEDREFVWLKRHLSNSELKHLKRTRIMGSDGDLIDGLWLVKESIRVYPHHQLASHILGDVNIDSEGLEGVELWFNERLRGKVVSVRAIKDALGRPTFIDTVAAKNIQDGESLSLTIDASLQFEVEEQLHNSVLKTGSKSGTVIVMNATNGEILAMANEPSFNANEKGVPPQKRRNRALTDGYEPGSTFKAVLVASALSNGAHLTDKVWAEQGSFTVQGHKISEAEAHEKFGWIDFKKMLKVSSNVGAAKVALKLGADHYLKTIKALGFGTKSGLGFPGEISGKIPARKDWSPLGLANIGFGQGVLVTPIQMTRAYAAILNGGFLVQPTLIKNSGLLATEMPQIPVRVFSQKVSQDLIEALQEVTTEGGTGTKAALPGYKVAGKTGTAQMVNPDTGKYSRDKHNASFIGFAVGVEPKIVIFVSLTEPRGSYYASVTAAPLFREVLGVVAHHYTLPYRLPLQPLAKSPSKSGFKLLGANQDQLKISQAAPENPLRLLAELKTLDVSNKLTWTMPALKGLTPREVFGILQGHRFKMEVKGTGIVSSQWPEGGNPIAEGATIRLKLIEP